MALLHTASIPSFYAFARVFRVAPAAALLGALAYGTAPMHLQSFVVAGHWQLAASFFLAPLLARETVLGVRAPSARRAAGLSLLLAWGLLADNERTITLLPVLAGLVVVEPGGARAPLRAGALVLGAGVVLGAAMSAAGTLPLLLESEWLALARDTSLFPTHHSALFSHPLLAIDGGSLVYALDATRPPGTAGAPGSFLLVLGATLTWLWFAARPGGSVRDRRLRHPPPLTDGGRASDRRAPARCDPRM